MIIALNNLNNFINVKWFLNPLSIYIDVGKESGSNIFKKSNLVCTRERAYPSINWKYHDSLEEDRYAKLEILIGDPYFQN